MILEDAPVGEPAPRRRWEPVRFLSQTAARVSLAVEAPRPGYVVFSEPSTRAGRPW